MTKLNKFYIIWGLPLGSGKRSGQWGKKTNLTLILLNWGQDEGKIIGMWQKKNTLPKDLTEVEIKANLRQGIFSHAG